MAQSTTRLIGSVESVPWLASESPPEAETPIIRYKVLRFNRWYNQLVSWTETGCEIQYTAGVLVRPVIPRSKLFIYDTLDTANKCISYDEWKERQIWRCECIDLFKFNGRAACWREAIERFWQKTEKPDLDVWPIGSDVSLTSGLTLIERVG